ncbi:hypothetical protein HaLaN_03307 [Haematococcus lacustris]|uniref:Uncharacterized protein n=1 Tax=Haematococcus lacustris TaxID=44745 RepID=A0A699YDY6_HAELA|nr:hypothetical protein HaLaN_03307 [Haematococcus lacustris]
MGPVMGQGHLSPLLQHPLLPVRQVVQHLWAVVTSVLYHFACGGPDLRTGQKRKAAEAQRGQSAEAGQAAAAGAIKKRLTVQPSVADGVAPPGELPESVSGRMVARQRQRGHP